MPESLEGQHLQVIGEGNTLLSVWGSNQARAEDRELLVNGINIGNTVSQKR